MPALLCGHALMRLLHDAIAADGADDDADDEADTQ
jgi:hypothetical protein